MLIIILSFIYNKNKWWWIVCKIKGIYYYLFIQFSRSIGKRTIVIYIFLSVHSFLFFNVNLKFNTFLISIESISGTILLKVSSLISRQIIRECWNIWTTIHHQRNFYFNNFKTHLNLRFSFQGLLKNILQKSKAD